MGKTNFKGSQGYSFATSNVEGDYDVHSLQNPKHKIAVIKTETASIKFLHPVFLHPSVIKEIIEIAEALKKSNGFY